MQIASQYQRCHVPSAKRPPTLNWCGMAVATAAYVSRWTTYQNSYGKRRRTATSDVTTTAMNSAMETKASHMSGTRTQRATIR